MTKLTVNTKSLYIAKYPEGICLILDDNRYLISDTDRLEHLDKFLDNFFGDISYYKKLESLSVISTVPKDSIDMSKITNLPSSLESLYITSLEDVNKNKSVLNNIKNLSLMYYGVWEELPKGIKNLNITDIMYVNSVSDIQEFVSKMKWNGVNVEVNKIVDLSVVKRNMNLLSYNLDSSEREVLDYIGCYVDKDMFYRIYNKY